MLVERGLLQYSEKGKCYVTGELVVDTNICLKAMCYSPHAYVDAGSITNSWMHLVMSDPELVRLGVEIELELDVDSTPSTRDDGLDHVIDAAATLCSTQRKMIWVVICSSCMFGRIGQEAPKKTPKMCKAYLEAAARIRPTAQLLVAAIKREDPNAINRNAINPDPNHPINRLGKQLKEEIDSLVPALLSTYDKKTIEHDVGTMWVTIQDALRKQRDVDTPAFLRSLKTCQKPVHVAVALRPGSMIPSQPLPDPKVLMVRNVMDADLVLKRSNVLDAIGSKMMALGAAMVGDAFGDVDTLPGHATPLYLLSQMQNVLHSNKESHNSLFCSRSGMMAAIDPETHEVLFRTDRLDFGHPFFDADYIREHALDAETTGAYRALCQLARADRDALLRAATELDAERTAHADEVASRLDEAYASGTCPNVVVFLAQGRYADRDGRAFTDRLALEKRLASIGVPCLPLLQGEGGIGTRSLISGDIDRYLYDALPRHLRVCRGRVVVVYPERHAYPETPEGMGQPLTKHLATKCRVFNETVAGAALADVTILDDLDSPRLDPYRAFVKASDAFLEKYSSKHTSGGAVPTVMLNKAAGFVSTADVSREAAEKRKAELGKVVAPGEFKLKDQSSRKKEPFDFEDFLKPDGVFDLARLEALKTNFETQIQASKDAKGPKKFNFDWWGKAELSQSNLARTLACSKFKSNGRGGVGVMGDYVKELNKKIKQLKASAAG